MPNFIKKLNFLLIFPIINMDKYIWIMTEEKTHIKREIIKGAEERNLELEVAYARLRKIGKDRFQTDFSANESLISKVKLSSQYFNLTIPYELHEYFIDINDAPLFWILDSPIMFFIDENTKAPEKEGVKGDSDSLKLAKDYYSKWVNTTRKSEKKYFAQSLQKTINKDKSKSLIKSIYGGVLFTFDETLKESETAQRYYEEGEMLVGEIQADEGLQSDLYYVLKIYSGFEHYLNGRIFEALQKFQEALVIKPDGITAKFYLALTEIQQGNKSTCFDLISDVYEYDMRRISYAVSANSFNLYQYFIKNPLSQNIFKYREFGDICQLLEDFLEGKELQANENLVRIRKKFEVFKELHLNEYQDPGVKNSFAFFEKILKNYFTSSLNLFLSSISLLWIKFNDTLQLVLSTIRQRFINENQKVLKIYDQNITDLNVLIEHLTKEIDEFKVKYKEKAKLAIAQYEYTVNEQMGYLERKLTHLSDDKENNPSTSFKSSFTYTIILSLLVVLVAGFASYSSNYSNELSGFGQMIKAILLAGGKWGIFTFIVGFFISAMSTVYAVYERSQEKQRIIREIANLKFVKEKNIEQIKAESEKNEKITIKNINERIATHRKRIEEIMAERKKHEEKLIKEIEEKVKEEANRLIELLEKA